MRVVVSGTGCISAAGTGVEQTINSFRHKVRNVKMPSLLDTGIKLPVFEVENFVCRSRNRTFSLAAEAVDQALKDASLSDLSSRRLGICIGTTVGSQLNNLDFYRSYRNSDNPSLKAVYDYLKENIAELIKKYLNVKGLCQTIVNACCSGTDAIGVGYSWITNDICDIVIAGGADELNLIPMSGFNSLGIASDSPCRPFDSDRNGLNLGEGSGILILENEKIAKQRLSPPFVCVKGYGTCSDAYHITSPHPEGIGLKKAVIYSMKQSDALPGDISFVNAHGTATINNDLIEGAVLNGIFGEKIPVVSTKGFTGHTLGAAGGLEAVFSVISLKYGWIPGTAGFSKKDPDIPFEPTKDVTQLKGNTGLSTSLGFGGQNSALVFSYEN